MAKNHIKNENAIKGYMFNINILRTLATPFGVDIYKPNFKIGIRIVLCYIVAFTGLLSLIYTLVKLFEDNIIESLQVICTLTIPIQVIIKKKI